MALLTRCILLAVLLNSTVVQAQQAQVPAHERSAFFGDLHIHTMYSFDAFTNGRVRTSPDDAYRFAKGEVIGHPGGLKLRLSGHPLDFLAVSDHASYLGVQAALSDPTSPTYNHPERERFVPNGKTTVRSVRTNLFALWNVDSDVAGHDVLVDAWQKTIDAAERHNDPGKFTAFVAYEYTPTPGNRHLHRNVIFRSKDAPTRPFSARDSGNPEDLWNWLDDLRNRGIEALAIPHNMNQSDGLAFPLETWQAEPIDADFANKRMRNEPIVEITQKKGASETHPSLSPNDEWADFQIVQYYLNKAENKNPISVFKGGYLRDALKTGLEMQVSAGFNPYEVGVIGSSDSHQSAGSYEEDRIFSGGRSSPVARGSAYPNHADKDASWEDFWTPRQATHGTGGLAGVWAESNTRASLFDAMRRRETFGTSGPRIRVRFFAGFDLPDDVDNSPDLVRSAYAGGVPMGGELKGTNNGAPKFVVWALRDPVSGWLQRAQVIKGWVEHGRASEAVFDVVCADGLVPDPATHRCPDNGAKVNLADCSVSRDRGAVSLKTLWRDPTFDPNQHAFYYLRVLENPSCRWSTWDALGLGIAPNPDLPATIQERAWSSPIWYRPQ
ncbi:MAG TPA: DUF3604 domain-containing protein [Pseudomonadales bacterium]|nr:DUF3604 domain-containing protein [Pseudomonadales bacterium]